MVAMRVLVNSPRRAVRDSVRRQLAGEEFEIIETEPGPAFIRAAGLRHPEVAVIDFNGDRHDTAELESELLRAIHPDMQVFLTGENGLPAAVNLIRRIHHAAGDGTCTA